VALTPPRVNGIIPGGPPSKGEIWSLSSPPELLLLNFPKILIIPLDLCPPPEVFCLSLEESGGAIDNGRDLFPFEEMFPLDLFLSHSCLSAVKINLKIQIPHKELFYSSNN
jgi:hypothetical protein